MEICRQFEEARKTRNQTLALVEDLSQAQSEHRPEQETWSVGEVLDHLVKLDILMARELDVAFNQRRRGVPFIYRSIADIETSIPWVLRPALPFFEIPFGVFNATVPLSVRNALTGNRSLPLQAPTVLKPRRGRSIDTLRQELGTAFDRFEEQQGEHPTIDVQRTYYYNPITGLNSIAQLYLFIANHEERHQKQLREILNQLHLDSAITEPILVSPLSDSATT